MRLKVQAIYTWPLALGLSFLTYGCGFPAMIPSGASVQRIAIPVFLNDTFEPSLEGKLTRLVKQEFLTRPGFRIIQDPAQAQLILEGRITSFGLTPLSFDRQFRAAEYRVSITAEVKVLEVQDRKPLWQHGGVQATAEFVASQDPGVSRSAQDLAIEEAAKRIAEEIWTGVSRLRLSEAPASPGQERGIEKSEFGPKVAPHGPPDETKEP